MAALRLVVVCLGALLLAAQQAALEHPLRHVGTTDEKSPLCSQHDALGAVLGAIGCADAAGAEAAPAARAVAFIAAPAISPASIAPSSRDPPALL
jgi:hypothetical protein